MAYASRVAASRLLASAWRCGAESRWPNSDIRTDSPATSAGSRSCASPAWRIESTLTLRGEHARLIPEWRRLVGAHPLRERLVAS